MVTIFWTQVRFPLGSPRNLALEAHGTARPGNSRDRGVSVSFQEGSSRWCPCPVQCCLWLPLRAYKWPIPSLLSLQNAWWGPLSWPHQLRFWPDLWSCPGAHPGGSCTLEVATGAGRSRGKVPTLLDLTQSFAQLPSTARNKPEPPPPRPGHSCCPAQMSIFWGGWRLHS